MDFTQRPPFTECLSRQAHLPPERFLVKGAEFGLACHPSADFQHGLGQTIRQFGGEENGGGGQARRQGQDDVTGSKLHPWIFFQLPNADQSAGRYFFNVTHRWFKRMAFPSIRLQSVLISAAIPPQSLKDGGSVAYPLTVCTAPSKR